MRIFSPVCSAFAGHQGVVSAPYSTFTFWIVKVPLKLSNLTWAALKVLSPVFTVKVLTIFPFGALATFTVSDKFV